MWAPVERAGSAPDVPPFSQHALETGPVGHGPKRRHLHAGTPKSCNNTELKAAGPIGGIGTRRYSCNPLMAAKGCIRDRGCPYNRGGCLICRGAAREAVPSAVVVHEDQCRRVGESRRPDKLGQKDWKQLGLRDHLGFIIVRPCGCDAWRNDGPKVRGREPRR